MCTPFLSTSSARSLRKRGFSLVELLVVICVMAVLSVGAIPAFNSIRGGQDLTSSAFEVAGLLEKARAFALAKNTYVYVGLAETLQTSDSIQPSPGGGRLVVAVMASKTGIRPTSMSGNDLVSVNRLEKFDNVKLETLNLDGNMARKTGSDVVNLASSPTSTFAGVVWSGPGGTSMKFDRVIEFDSSGVARFTDKDNMDGWLEIPLKPAHAGPNTVAALQLDSVTGAVHVYRP